MSSLCEHVVARAPGRVNLIGDHTDYQDGWCLPVAIDRAASVDWRAGDGLRITATSSELDGIVVVDDPDTHTGPAWGRSITATVQALGELGITARGGALHVSSTVPLGSGLSSSAALHVALALAASTAAGAPLQGVALARAAQHAEHLTGVPCGLLDQMASVFGVEDHALLLDCRELTTDPIEIPADLAILVAHCGLPRALADSAYAERRSACEAAATRLGVATLRDATLDAVRDDPFARHVVSENARVHAFATALRAHDTAAVGALLDESHASLADDFRVSTPELDTLTTCLRAAGAFGARLTGAGFGGCAVAVAPAADADEIVADASARYRAATQIEPLAFVAHAADGARVVTAE